MKWVRHVECIVQRRNVYTILIGNRERNKPFGTPRHRHEDMWAVSRKRMGKHVAKERLITGNQLISKHGFHGYGN
jgi:hypothetical protein